MAATDERVRCWASGARAGLSLKELQEDLAHLQQTLRAGARMTIPAADAASRAKFYRSHAEGRIDDIGADAIRADGCGPPGAVSWTDDWRRWVAGADVSQTDPGKYTGMLVMLDGVQETLRHQIAAALR